MSRRPKLLIEEPPLQVLPTLAVRIGLNEAIVLQQLHYLTQVSKGPPEKTLSELSEEFPFWTSRTLQRATRGLRDRGLLVVEQPRGTDRRNRYVVDHDAIEHLEEAAFMATDCRDGARQDGAIEGATSSLSNRPNCRDVLEGENCRTAERQEDEAHASSSPARSEPHGSDLALRATETTEASLGENEPSAAQESKRRADDRNDDPEYVRLAELLADLIAANRDGRRPKASDVVKWRQDIRLMAERDELGDRDRALERIEGAIRWSQEHHFWRAVILSAGKLREKYDQLEAAARAERTSRRAAGTASVLADLEGRAA